MLFGGKGKPTKKKTGVTKPEKRVEMRITPQTSC